MVCDVAVPGYRVGGPLGHGGVGVVWQAERIADGQVVALKVSHGHDVITRQRFERETHALERIGPPFVPKSYEHGTLADGRRYLVMERIEGRSLDILLGQFRAPPPHEWIERVSDGLIACLAAAHRHRIVHRDLKPENIFVEGSGDHDQTGVARIVLLDLGLVRILPDPPRAPHSASSAPTDSPSTPNAIPGSNPGSNPADELTRTGVVVGTLEYMAPEQLSGSKEIDARIDLYAFGAVLYELFALRPPFVRDPGYIEYAHQAVRPPPPSRFAAVPSPLEDIILCCLAKNPDDRPADAVALRDALTAAWQECRDRSSGNGAATAASDTSSSPSPGATKRAKRSKQTGVAAFVSGVENVAALRAALESFGGVLGHVAERGRVACVFTSDVSERPVRRALTAITQFLGEKIIDCAVLDLIPMTVRGGARGKLRFMSSALKDPSRYPGTDDPSGRVLLTASARERLPGVDVEAERCGPRHVVVTVDDRSESSASGTTEMWFHTQPLVGHDDLIRELTTSVHDATANSQATLVTLIGDIGLGKSHICNTLLLGLHHSYGVHAEIIALRPIEPVAGVRDATARHLLGQMLQLPTPSPVEPSGDSGDDRCDSAKSRAALAEQGRAALVAALGEEIAGEVYESVGALLGWLSPDAPEVMRLRAAPGTLRASAARALAEALRRKGRERPLCVIIDDAQWADDITLDALEQATAREARLWVCALARPQLIESRQTWGQRAVRTRRRELEPLTGERGATLCRQLLRPAELIPESVITRLVHRARGIPLLLVELVRALQKQGLVRRQHDTGPWHIASEALESLPDTPIVEWLTSRELDALSDNLSGHARLAAMLGAEFTPEEIHGVLSELERAGGADDIPLDAQIGLDMLHTSGLITRVPGKPSYRFAHGMLRQGIAVSASDDFRRRVHRAAYRYYRDHVQAMDPTDRRARLARHAAEAGERERAAEIYLELASDAQARHAYLEADLLYHRALHNLEPTADAKRQVALSGRGVVRWRLARYQDALDDLSQARDIARQRVDTLAEIRLLLEASTVLDWIDEWRHSRELAELAAERAAELHDPLLDAWITMARGRSACRFNDHPRAIELLLDAADRAGALGDDGYETEIISLMLAGGLLAGEGRLDESHEVFERGIPRCVEHRDDLHRTAMLINRSYLWIARGDMTRLLIDLEEARALARRLGNANLERHAAINLSWYLHWAGRHREAEPLARRAVELDDQRLREDTRRPEAKVLVARLRWAQGDEAECRELIAEIQRHQQWASRRNKTEAMLVPSEQVLFDMVLFALDDPGQDAWDALIERAQDRCQMEPEIVEVLHTSAILALRRGAPDSARSMLERALKMDDELPEALTRRIHRQLAAIDESRE